MKKLFLILFFGSFFSGANSQNEGFIYDGGLTIKTSNEFYLYTSNTSKNINDFLKDNEIEGSPYLNNDFIKGYVVTIDSLKYIDIPLRYNIYNDEIEFEQNANVFALDNPLNYNEISIGTHIFLYLAFESGSGDNQNKSTYFEVLNPTQDLLLLKRFGVQFNKVTSAQGYVEAQPANFKKTPERFYLKFKNNELAKEVGNLKSTLSMFSDRSDEIASFIKKRKLKLRKEEDLITIVNYYNGLK